MTIKEMSLKDQIDTMFPQEKDIPDIFKINLPLNQTKYLIDGELREWSGPFQEILSPVCINEPQGTRQQFIGTLPELTPKEAMEALEAASKAYDRGMGTWPTMSVKERIKHVQDFTFCMKQNKKDIVNLLMWEIAKPYSVAEAEFDRTVEYIINTIDALKDLDRCSSRFTIENNIIAQIRRAPLGVALCMGPFNYPLNETFTTLIPALIMGNTVVFKPPKFGCLLFNYLLEGFRDSFPKGVINTVYGEGRVVIPPLMSSGKIDVLAFIGTSRVADSLKKQHPKPHRLRSVLGLEAKNPAIILPDADLDLAVRECVLGSLSFNGQRCTALKILFVHSQITDVFLEKFSSAVANLNIGMPWDKDINITPLPETNKTKYLMEYIEDAQKHGARIVNENGASTNNTFFYPAILYPVNSNMRIYSEEQFGPIVPVASFDNIEVPINYITESNYGQQVSIFGNNPDKIAKLIDPLVNQVCRVNINSQCQRGPDIFPFTGRKDSAEATLSVSDALKVFSIRTLVATRDLDTNKQIVTSIVRDHKSNFLSTDFIL